MRHAILIASSYHESLQLGELPEAPVEAQSIAARLRAPDADFVVHTLVADRDLPERLDELLWSLEPAPAGILLYFRGYAAWIGAHAPALVLNAPRLRAYSLSRLCAALERCSPRSLLVLDLSVVVDAGRLATDAAAAIGEVIDESSAVEAIVVTHYASQQAEPESPLSPLLLRSWDWLAAVRGPAAATSLDLFQLIQIGERLFGGLFAARLSLSERPLELAPPIANPRASTPDAAPELEPVDSLPPPVVARRHAPADTPAVAERARPSTAGDEPAAPAEPTPVSPLPPVAPRSAPPMTTGTTSVAPPEDDVIDEDWGESTTPADAEPLDRATHPGLAPPSIPFDPALQPPQQPGPARPDARSSSPAPSSPAPAALRRSAESAPPPPPAPPAPFERETPGGAATPFTETRPPKRRTTPPPKPFRGRSAPPPKPVSVAPAPAPAPARVGRVTLLDEEFEATLRSEAAAFAAADASLARAATGRPAADAAAELGVDDDWTPSVPAPPEPAAERTAPSSGTRSSLTASLEAIDEPEPDPAIASLAREIAAARTRKDAPADSSPTTSRSPGTVPLAAPSAVPGEPTVAASPTAPAMEGDVPPPVEPWSATATPLPVDAGAPPAPPARPAGAAPTAPASAPAAPEPARPNAVEPSLVTGDAPSSPTPRAATASEAIEAAGPLPPQGSRGTFDPEEESGAAAAAPAEDASAAIGSAPGAGAAPTATPMVAAAAEIAPVPEASAPAPAPSPPPASDAATVSAPAASSPPASDAAAAPAPAPSPPPASDAASSPAPMPDEPSIVIGDDEPVAPTASSPPASDAAAASAPAPSSPRASGVASSPAPMPDEPSIVIGDDEPVAPSRFPEAPELTLSERIARAEQLTAEHQFDAALLEVSRALKLADDEDQITELHARAASIARQRGDVGRAVAHYEEVLGRRPLDADALFWASQLLCDRGDFSRAARLHELRLAALVEREEQEKALETLAELWIDRARDLAHGRVALERLVRSRGEEPPLLERLTVVLDGLGDFEEAIRVRRRLAYKLADDPSRRAAVLVGAARVAHDRLHKVEFAVDLAEQALRADPAAIEALDFVVAWLMERKDWPMLARAFESVLEKLPDGAAARDLAQRLGALYRDELRDPSRAIRAFERAATIAPTDIDLRFELTQLLQQVGEPARALKHCRAAIQAAPRDPGAHLLAHELAVRTGAHDSAWNAAHALDFLGEADINASLHADTHRPEGLLPVTATLTDEHWQSGSFTPGRDVQLEAILALLRAPAIEHRLDSLARARELPQPDPTLRVDPAASTTTLARSFLWTVQLLAVPQPALYVDPALETGLVALPTREPSSVVNRSLGSGLDLRELSFLWGRHLASFRPEARLLTFYPTAELLAQLLAAAAAVARDGNDESELAPDVDALARRIRNDLTEAERGALVDALRDFPFAEADRRLLEWARGVELTAARAGLVACGDVSVAAPLTERFPVVGHTTAFDQVSALLAFTASDEYAAIREHLGVVVRG